MNYNYFLNLQFFTLILDSHLRIRSLNYWSLLVINPFLLFYFLNDLYIIYFEFNRYWFLNTSIMFYLIQLYINLIRYFFIRVTSLLIQYFLIIKRFHCFIYFLIQWINKFFILIPNLHFEDFLNLKELLHYLAKYFLNLNVFTQALLLSFIQYFFNSIIISIDQKLNFYLFLFKSQIKHVYF